MYRMKQYIKRLGITVTLIMLSLLIGQMRVSAANKRGELTVTFLDVGQGDSILLQSEGQTMLVDAGKAEYGHTVVDYLKEQDIETLTYAVVTHDDPDHIGGFASVVKNIGIKKILHTAVRNNEETNSKKANDIIDHSNIPRVVPEAGSTMQLGSATIQFLAPNRNQYSAYNDYSIVMRVVNGNNSFLLTGDAEVLSEKEMLKKGYPLKSDVLKVGHHSALTSSSQEFIDAVEPSISVISCNSEGKAGFPRLATLEKLTKSDIFRTDLSGNIVLVSDGTSITTDAEPYFYANSTFNQSVDRITRTFEKESSVLENVDVESDYEDMYLHNLNDDDTYDLVITEPLELNFTADWGISKGEGIEYSLVDAGDAPDDIDSMEWKETEDGSVTLTDDFSGTLYVKYENQLGNIVIRKTTGFLLDCKAPTNCNVTCNIPNLRLVSAGAVNTYNRYTSDNWYPTFHFSGKYGISGKGSIEYMLVERGEAFCASDPWITGNELIITDDFIGRVYVRFKDGAGNTVIKKTQGFKWIEGRPINHMITANVEGINLLLPSESASACVSEKNVNLKFSADFGHGGKKCIQYQIVKKTKKVKTVKIVKKNGKKTKIVKTKTVLNKYNPSGSWVTGDSVTLTKGFNGTVYVRFIDKLGYSNVRKTNAIRIKK